MNLLDSLCASEWIHAESASFRHHLAQGHPLRCRDRQASVRTPVVADRDGAARRRAEARANLHRLSPTLRFRTLFSLRQAAPAARQVPNPRRGARRALVGIGLLGLHPTLARRPARRHPPETLGALPARASFGHAFRALSGATRFWTKNSPDRDTGQPARTPGYFPGSPAGRSTGQATSTSCDLQGEKETANSDLLGPIKP